jgi:hypothetical protein
MKSGCEEFFNFQILQAHSLIESHRARGEMTAASLDFLKRDFVDCELLDKEQERDDKVLSLMDKPRGL